MKNITCYGVIFRSIKSFAEFSGISDRTCRTHFKKGKSAEELCSLEKIKTHPEYSPELVDVSPSKKKTKTKKGDSKSCKSIDTKKIEEEFNKEYLITQLLSASKSTGMVGVQALKELKVLLDEKEVDKDLNLNISFVPIIFDGQQFHANLEEEEVILGNKKEEVDA